MCQFPVAHGVFRQNLAANADGCLSQAKEFRYRCWREFGSVSTFSDMLCLCSQKFESMVRQVVDGSPKGFLADRAVAPLQNLYCLNKQPLTLFDLSRRGRSLRLVIQRYGKFAYYCIISGVIWGYGFYHLSCKADSLGAD